MLKKKVDDKGNETGEYINNLALVYYVSFDNTHNFSLRSNKDNPKSLDVSKVAKIKGGGGHKHAAGFSIDTKNNKITNND